MYPRVGVGVVLLTENRELLVGRRKGSHGAGQWALPGGALEWREDSFDCATREVFEEIVGRAIQRRRFITALVCLGE